MARDGWLCVVAALLTVLRWLLSLVMADMLLAPWVPVPVVDPPCAGPHCLPMGHLI